MIERCTDFRHIRKFCDWDLSIDPECIYLAETDNGGIWFFHPHLDGLMIHANLTVSGHVAKQSATDAINWIFANTAWESVYANIPESRHDVRSLAYSVGFRFLNLDGENRLYEFNRPQQMVA